MFKIILAIVVVVVLALVVTRWQGAKNRDFKATAEQTQATVTLRDERESGQKNRRKERHVEYRFVLEGQEYTGADMVEFDDLWQALVLGDSIAVYYDPENPAKNIPAVLLERRLGMAQKIENSGSK